MGISVEIGRIYWFGSKLQLNRRHRRIEVERVLGDNRRWVLWTTRRRWRAVAAARARARRPWARRRTAPRCPCPASAPTPAATTPTSRPARPPPSTSPATTSWRLPRRRPPPRPPRARRRTPLSTSIKPADLQLSSSQLNVKTHHYRLVCYSNGSIPMIATNRWPETKLNEPRHWWQRTPLLAA